MDLTVKEGKEKIAKFEGEFSKKDSKPKWFFKKDVSEKIFFIYQQYISELYIELLYILPVKGSLSSTVCLLMLFIHFCDLE